MEGFPDLFEKSDVSKGFGLRELTIKRSQTHLAACCDCPLRMSVGFSLKCWGLQMETSAAMVISASLTLRFIDTEKYLKLKEKILQVPESRTVLSMCSACASGFVCWVLGFFPHHILGFREHTHLLVVIKPVCYVWAIFLLQLHERMWLLRPLMLFLIQ